MPDQGLLIVCIVAMVALFLLVQIFLSLRPNIVWGLFMPVFFLLVWLYVAFDMSFLSFIPLKIELNQVGRSLFISVGAGGVIASLVVMVLCRIWRQKRSQRKAQEREERRLERQQRLAAEAARGEALHLDAAVAAEGQRIEQTQRQGRSESQHQSPPKAKRKRRGQVASPQHHQATADQSDVDLEQTLVYSGSGQRDAAAAGNDVAVAVQEQAEEAAAPQDYHDDSAANVQNRSAGGAEKSGDVASPTVTTDDARHQLADSWHAGVTKAAAVCVAGTHKIVELCRSGASSVKSSLHGWKQSLAKEDAAQPESTGVAPADEPTTPDGVQPAGMAEDEGTAASIEEHQSSPPDKEHRPMTTDEIDDEHDEQNQ